MKRYDLINALIKKHKYKKYLEIGVRDNFCFNKIKIKDKSGVDPMKDDWEIEKGKMTGWDSSKVPVKYRITSDEYFEKYNHKYDIIFIDGLHENEQVYRDINNSLKCLNSGGTIIMHDVLLNANVMIGRNCIINTKSLIEHDVTVGDHSQISTGAIVNSTVTVGKKCFIGSNTVIKQTVKIKSNSFINMGTKVFKDV